MPQKIKPNINLGKNIRRMRLSNNLTQEQVTAKLQLMNFNISRGIYSQIECGIHGIDVETLTALKDIFNAEYDDFFTAE
jgi:transcriptional regulator with XRE-family HTH domain